MQWVTSGDPEVQKQRGKWVVRQSGYDPVTGLRRVKQLGTFGTKREALERRKALCDGRAGSATESVAEFLESVWLASKVARVEANTLDQYRWAVDRHIVPYIGAVRLRDMTPEVVDRWIAAVAAPGPDGERRLGATSVRLVRRVLSMAMAEAVERGRLVRNPVPLTQPPRRQRSRGKAGWSLEEARRFLDAARDHRLYAAFHLALVTGMRRGEVLGLRWEDVDLEAGELRVVQQLTLVHGTPVLKSLKTETSERIVTFGTRTADVLGRHRAAQEAEFFHAGVPIDETDLVFTTPLGTWVDPNNFRRLMDRLIVEAGVPRITPHGMRHTAQSVGRVVVGDDKVMQERLGHADIGITLNTYTHTASSQHRMAGERIDEAFASLPTTEP